MSNLLSVIILYLYLSVIVHILRQLLYNTDGCSINDYRHDRVHNGRINNIIRHTESGHDRGDESHLESKKYHSISENVYNIKWGDSAYNHAINGGTIPTATWNATSTCNVTGITNTAVTGLNQSLGNLIWNSPTHSADVAIEYTGTYQGNVTISGMGTGTIRVANTNTNRTLTVNGNFVHSDGEFRVDNGDGGSALNVTGNLNISGTANFIIASGGGPATAAVTGNVNITGGTFDLSDNNAGIGNLNLLGNFSHTAGSFGSSTDVATITMTGAGGLDLILRDTGTIDLANNDVSIDAFTAETYQKVRGGRLEQVDRNVNRMLERIRQLGARTKVVVSFINQPLNQHEALDFKKYWLELQELLKSTFQ